MKNTFPQWLRDQLRAHNMNQAELARRSDMSEAIISHLLRGKRNPSHDTLTRIAEAFRMPVDLVYRAAGILPPVEQEQDASSARLVHMMQDLHDEQKAVILILTEEFVRQNEEANKSASSETLSLQIR